MMFKADPCNTLPSHKHAETDMERIAIMQPYFFPYLGYFQLFHAVDEFVFLDDVKFIKGGWINRNQFLTADGQVKYISIPVDHRTIKKKIAEVKTVLERPQRDDILNKMREWYQKAPYFEQVFSLIRDVIYIDSEYICDLSMESIRVTADYLNVKRRIDRSTNIPNQNGSKKADRLVQIAKHKMFERL